MSRSKMPHPMLLILALAAPLHGESSAPPALDALLAAAAAPVQPVQGIRERRTFDYWVSLGTAIQSLDIVTPLAEEPDESGFFGGDLGFYRWRGDFGLGMELGAWFSSWDAPLDSLGTTSDSVDVSRFMLGARLADRGFSENFLTFLRAGIAFREDGGEILSDDGLGWYAGAGFDWSILGGLAITPQVLYMDTESFDAEEFLGTVQLTLQF